MGTKVGLAKDQPFYSIFSHPSHSECDIIQYIMIMIFTYRNCFLQTELWPLSSLSVSLCARNVMIKDWKPPAGIVGWQCLFLPTGLHSNSIDTERPPPGNSSISRCEPWNRCTTLPLLKCLRLEDNFSQVFFGKKKTYSSDNFDFSAISSIFIFSKNKPKSTSFN